MIVGFETGLLFLRGENVVILSVLLVGVAGCRFAFSRTSKR